MINPRTVASIVVDSMAATSFTVILLGIAAAVALLLGTVGIYGVVAYIVSRRTQEIGVRIALGAPAGVVLNSFLRQGLVLTGIGVGVGLVASLGISRVLASLLYGVSATDPVTFAGTAVLLVSVSLLATWLPARRAARVDPVEALRGEEAEAPRGDQAEAPLRTLHLSGVPTRSFLESAARSGHEAPRVPVLESGS
jgi:ABC-type antimicrobial peptide transport system permease subunit